MKKQTYKNRAENEEKNNREWQTTDGLACRRSPRHGVNSGRISKKIKAGETSFGVWFPEATAGKGGKRVQDEES